jgi:hypothetical protein
MNIFTNKDWLIDSFVERILDDGAFDACCTCVTEDNCHPRVFFFKSGSIESCSDH